MWRLESIEAESLCAFEHMKYTLPQQRTTLVFGDNMDNESQNSNGAGKSALIEAIVISITGEPLRKVSMDEIINDAHDSCRITAHFLNQEEGTEMEVRRMFTRKKPQAIEVSYGPYGAMEAVKEASVQDYNKYVLDMIGISKDAFYANYVLTVKKSHSFLSCTDRDKKDIINQFSNGILVNEAIDHLHEDTAVVAEQLDKADKAVAEQLGKVDAILNEIANLKAEKEQRSDERARRIQSWRDGIASKRQLIRTSKDSIQSSDRLIKQWDDADQYVESVWDTTKNISEAYDKVSKRFAAAGLLPIIDYDSCTRDLNAQLEKKKAVLDNATAQFEEAKRESARCTADLEAAKQEYDEKLTSLTADIDASQKTLARINASLSEINDMIERDERKCASLRQSVSSLENQLSGVIKCPHCSYEFTLANDVDIAGTRKALQQKRTQLQAASGLLSQANASYAQMLDRANKVRQESNQKMCERDRRTKELSAVQDRVNNILQRCRTLQKTVESAHDDLEKTQKAIDSQYESMFDEAYRIIDTAIDNETARIKQCELDISTAEGAIKTYEESIKDAEKATDDDMLSRLQSSKERYDQELAAAEVSKGEAEKLYAQYKEQESVFIEFKTYLANIKINAINEMTNDFLEAIGSDIRIKLTGYTLLRSGKVRDKISVSLIRDGVDCGSFEKFSKGEQTRVELANILAMHKLTNISCADGKGLDLLIFDEILDATDEKGLANIFKALNDTQITSLVVSHGNVAENYPNRLIIHKHNGISYIEQ